MSPLRQRMLEDMQLRNFSAGTQRSYIHYMADFAGYYWTSPDRLSLDDIIPYVPKLSLPLVELMGGRCSRDISRLEKSWPMLF